jgi:2,3-bisphosphoglycerate-independent phosphoglycerate mutase
MKKKVALIILDGWGIGKSDASNAIHLAHTPFTNTLNQEYPHATLRTDGEHVGLPDGQMGNSEVGHMNIGAGRVVYQELVRINKSVQDKTFHQNTVVRKAFEYAQQNGKKVHLIGLISDGGVHSHWKHAAAFAEVAKEYNRVDTYLHGITDGRDTDPKSAMGYFQALENTLTACGVKIASIIGRYYAMDRDKRWERVKKAYDLYVHGLGKPFDDYSDAIEHHYAQNTTDEFIEPCILNEKGKIEKGDVVFCFNFRTDRCREISQVLSQEAMEDFQMTPIESLYFVTMTQYDEKFKNVHVIFEKDNLEMTLGEVLSLHQKTQLRIAETEKYPHVTFFFNGGREEPFEGERRAMLASPKVSTYDLQPEMSAKAIETRVIEAMQLDQPDFICLNFANPDMVGHTGVMSAIIQAVETVDACLEQVVSAGIKLGYSFIIIADHGNAEMAMNEDGSPNTAHTTHPVPIWVLDHEIKSVKSGILADIAPTVLDLLKIEKPNVMSGSSLIAIN